MQVFALGNGRQRHDRRAHRAGYADGCRGRSILPLRFNFATEVNPCERVKTRARSVAIRALSSASSECDGVERATTRSPVSRGKFFNSPDLLNRRGNSPKSSAIRMPRVLAADKTLRIGNNASRVAKADSTLPSRCTSEPRRNPPFASQPHTRERHSQSLQPCLQLQMANQSGFLAQAHPQASFGQSHRCS